MRRRPNRPLLSVLVASLVIAGCGSGESVLDAGNQSQQPTATIPATTPASSSPPATAADGSTIPTSSTTTEPPPTTEPSLLADLPPCPVDALDAVTSPVGITFWHGMNSANEVVLQGITDTYNSSQNKVHVTLENQGGYNQLIDKYFQSDSGSRPEVLQMPEYTLKLLADSGSVVPSQACAEATGYSYDDLIPRALATYTTQGVTWGTPFNVSSPVLVYNRRMFEEAGLDPDKPPATLDELRAVSQTLVDSGVATYGLALESGVDSGGGWFLEQWLARMGQYYVDNGNGRVAPATRVVYDTPATVDLLTQVQSMVTDGLAIYVGDNATGTDQLLKLADQSAPAAMTIATSAFIGGIMDALSGGLIPGFTREDLGIAPMPGPGEPGALVGGAALYVVAGKPDVEAAAAWDYVSYLTGPAAQSVLAAGTGYAPSAQAAIDVDPLASTYAADPRFKVAYDQVLANVADAAYLGPIAGPMRELRIVSSHLIDAVLSGADVQTEVTAAARQADSIIADYNANN